MLTKGLYFCVKLALLQLYPAYICYKAIKADNQTEYASLLKFWVVSISYLSVEYFSDIFLFWIPFYTEVKLIIALWLILPQTKGASVFYTGYLDPFLNAHEKQIDKTLLEIQAKLKESVVFYGKQAIDSLKKLVSDNVFKGASQQQPEPIVVEESASSISVNSPYNLFSTLISSTASKLQKLNTDEQSEATPSTSTPTIHDDEILPDRLSRTDSHDSLQSYVTIKNANVTESQATWGGYLSSWIWKAPPTEVTEDKKQN